MCQRVDQQVANLQWMLVEVALLSATVRLSAMQMPVMQSKSLKAICSSCIQPELALFF